MAARQGDWIDNDIVAYIAERTSPQPDAALDALRTETSTLGDVAIMQVSLDEGALLTILTRLAAATFAVEVGTFTGYSSICIARGLQPGGRLLCCDVSEKFTAIARRAWERAGVAERIELRSRTGARDAAGAARRRVDRSRVHRRRQAELRELLRRAAAPRAPWRADPRRQHAVVRPGRRPGGRRRRRNLTAIRRFNDTIAADDRVANYILPVSDGLTVITKL